MKRKPYLYKCEKLEGFLQQLAVAYVSNGKYFYYYSDVVKAGRKPEATDRFWVEEFGVGISRWAKARRRQKGLANYQYIRWGRFYVLLVSRGDRSELPERVRKRLRDCRRSPIRFSCYRVSYKPDRSSQKTLKRKGRVGKPEGHVSVALTEREYEKLSARAMEIALGEIHQVEQFFKNLEYTPFKPIQQQTRQVWRKVNRERKSAGLEPLSEQCLKWFKVQCFPFGNPEKNEESKGKAI